MGQKITECGQSSHDDYLPDPPAAPACGLHYEGRWNGHVSVAHFKCDVCGYAGDHDARPGCKRAAPAEPVAKWTEAEEQDTPLWRACLLAADAVLKIALHAGARFRYHPNEERRGVAGTIYERVAAAPAARPCTCHPDDNPPVPCPQKYTLSECRVAEPADATVERVMELYRECLRVSSSQKSIGKDFDRVDTALRAKVERIVRENAWFREAIKVRDAEDQRAMDVLKERAEAAEQLARESSEAYADSATEIRALRERIAALEAVLKEARKYAEKFQNHPERPTTKGALLDRIDAACAALEKR